MVQLFVNWPVYWVPRWPTRSRSFVRFSPNPESQFALGNKRLGI
jgi:hypothetical protein